MPGIGFAEMGPVDLGLSLLGSTKLQLSPYPPQLQEARDRVFAACRTNGIAVLEGCTPDNVIARLDEGVRQDTQIVEAMDYVAEREGPQTVVPLGVV